MVKRKVKNQSAHYAQIPLDVLKTQAFSTLSSSAHVLLMRCLAKYRPNTNGDISLVQSEYSFYGLGCKKTMTRAIRELLERRLIVRTRHGSRGSSRLCSLYGVAWLPMDANPKFTELDGSAWKPDHAYKTWEPSSRRENGARLALVKASTEEKFTGDIRVP